MTGIELKQWLKRNKYTYAQFAIRIGVSRGTVYNYTKMYQIPWLVKLSVSYYSISGELWRNFANMADKPDATLRDGKSPIDSPVVFIP